MNNTRRCRTAQHRPGILQNDLDGERPHVKSPDLHRDSALFSAFLFEVYAASRLPRGGPSYRFLLPLQRLPLNEHTTRCLHVKWTSSILFFYIAFSF
jgi:hypothetical protein